MKKFTEKIMKLELLLAVIAMAGFFICVLLQVLSRYMPFITVIWAEELSRFLFIWSVLLGTSVVVYKNDHFSFEAIRESVKGKTKLFVEIIINLLLIGFGIYIFLSGIKLTSQFWDWSFNSLPWLKQRYTWSALIITGFSVALFSVEHLLNSIAVYREEI